MSERKRVTCPETGHLEEVELEQTPLGLVVTGCSRFPGRELGCPRECTRRMDRRARLDVEDKDRVLVVVDSIEDQAGGIATVLAEELAADGLSVDVAALRSGHVPPLADYDVVVVGSQMRLGRHARAVLGYIREQRGELATLPALFYSVGSGSVAGPPRMTAGTGWAPVAAATFPDAEPSRRAAIRLFAQRIADEVPETMRPSLG